ncbi:MAG: response regulator transcription factor [Candidatus Accumulibacter sp.]|jgi:two-component system OmpR family response regulator|nr:response regulator transcription factor [Accumulibacter sp.]
MNILLAEDDALLADGLARALRQSRYGVDWARDGAEADMRLAQRNYDLAILDLSLPGLDGSDVLQRLRERGQRIPALIITAREAIGERVRLLDLGADDYLVKPVSIDELEARIRALIRRGSSDGAPIVTLGHLRLDRNGKRAWVHSDSLDLTAKEWEVLEYLALRANKIVSKEKIMDSLCDEDHAITPNAVEKYISRLRTKIAPSGTTIRTVRGLGYYLDAPVQ